MNPQQEFKEQSHPKSSDAAASFFTPYSEITLLRVGNRIGFWNTQLDFDIVKIRPYREEGRHSRSLDIAINSKSCETNIQSNFLDHQTYRRH